MRTTRLRHGGSELSLAVVDGLAFLVVDEGGPPARIEVPVPALLAMIHAADAGARGGGDVGDSWGSGGYDGGWSGGCGCGGCVGSGDDDGRWDLGRGRDPGARRSRAAWRDRGEVGDRCATVIPFPLPPPPPARSGTPWTAAHDAAVRTAWLAADPGADRAALLAAIAGAVQRRVGGVTARLPRLGCDPACPGRALPADPSPSAV